MNDKKLARRAAKQVAMNTFVMEHMQYSRRVAVGMFKMLWDRKAL